GAVCGAVGRVVPVAARGARTDDVSACPAPGFTPTDLPLHLGHTERLANQAQRLALIATDKGCTRPGCSAPASLTAVHHITEWAKNGPTDIENLTLACDACHALIHHGPGGWKTVVMGPDTAHPGRTGWIAPEHIDPTRTPRVNHRHHPGELMAATLARIQARDEHERAKLKAWLNARNTTLTRQ
ncbi:HNH endonuclease signature motif containing protein, partial [Nocardia acidivorans]|uniref:HNH endonuclease signature motif containing protein n=1 Tax=Nocardia acidivorans TaxID=404580 RepID=UPI000AD76246